MALAIAQQQSIDPIIARALVARGVSIDDAADYLRPSLRAALPDPFILRDMEAASARLAAAIAQGETIGVFGDYDVDGTTATAILLKFFRGLGASAVSYLPDRILEGYGPSIEAFRALAAEGASVIVTVDCGANAHAVIEAAARDGLCLIVVDHHLMDGPPPEGAAACVNPNRLDDVSGLTGLSAAGLAFLMAVAVNRALRQAGYFTSRAEPDLKALLDLAALGLVCDVMPMTGLTRVLVAQGLKVLGARGNIGLAALAARGGAKGTPSTYHLGFVLGPRINAAGRIGHARLALDLLTTDDEPRAAALAERLHLLNAERQLVEQDVLDQAIAMIEAGEVSKRGGLVVVGEGWHPGVIGVVAGRLKERYDLPAIVISLDGDSGKGSGRSITGVDLGAAVVAARKAGLLAGGGGHAMAAGLTISRDAIGPFTDFIDGALSAAVDTARCERIEPVDAVLALSGASKALVDAVERVGPFGPQNPEPLFCFSGVAAGNFREVGGAHLAFDFKGTGGESVRAIAFRSKDTPLGAMLRSSGRLHVLGRVRADDWRGGDAVQVQISDAAAAR